MFRLSQIIRNSFIRFEGLLYQIFGFFRQLFSKIFGFFAQLLGFTQSSYFLESNEVQDRKSNATKQPIATEPTTASSAPATTRRRPDAKMDYYLNLARQTKNSK